MIKVVVERVYGQKALYGIASLLANTFNHFELWTWGQVQLDTLRYGYPRTTQVDHTVGHHMIHFVATNLKGQIYLVEIVGNTPGASHLLIGPRLLGPGVDLAPVMLHFEGADVVVEAAGIVTRFPAAP